MIFIPLYYYLEFYNVPQGLDHVCYDLTSAKKWFLSKSKFDSEVYHSMSYLTELDVVPTSALETIPKISMAIKEYVEKLQKELRHLPRCVDISAMLETDLCAFSDTPKIITKGLFLDGTTVYKTRIITFEDDPTPLDQLRPTVPHNLPQGIPLKKRIVKRHMEEVYNLFDWEVEFEALGEEPATDGFSFVLRCLPHDRRIVLQNHRVRKIFMDYAVVCAEQPKRSRDDGTLVRLYKTVTRKSIRITVENDGTMWGSEQHAVISLDDYSYGCASFVGACNTIRVGILPESLRDADGSQQTSQDIIDWILEYGSSV